MELLLLQSGGDSTSFFVMMGAIILVFYFFMVRPQNKKVKEQRTFLDELEKGDNVITGGGIHGKVNKIDGNIVTLEVGKGTFIRVEKDIISKDMSERLLDDGKKE